MSNSLVRKGLELFGYEKNVKQEKKKRKHVRYKGTLDLIPAKHRILSKNDKTGIHVTQAKKIYDASINRQVVFIDLGRIIERSGKLTVYETKKRLAAQGDPVDENVQRLLMLGNNRFDPNIANKLFERAVKKRYIPKRAKPKESEATAFTEQDFKKFEQEYVDQ